MREAIHALRLGLQKDRRDKELLTSGQLAIGRYSYGLPDVIVYPGETQRVVIGSFCSIADDVRIFVGGNHRPDWVSTYPFRIKLGLPGAHTDGCPTSNGDVTIGHDVWIGSGARVLSGVRIGNGAVIGASSVVASDVAPYAVVVGNPAREVRKRFGDAHIAMLERLAWWRWPLERIIDNVALLCSSDLDSFLAAQTRGGPAA
ncbi:MAG: CatB-related O-acetyltransferase [Solirubrobacteraceae bacterium]